MYIICVYIWYVVPKTIYTNLESQIMIFLFFLRSQSIPPFSKYLTDSPVVWFWVTLMYKGSVTFAKDHECIHWSANMIFVCINGCQGSRFGTFFYLNFAWIHYCYYYYYYNIHKCKSYIHWEEDIEKICEGHTHTRAQKKNDIILNF